MNKSIPVHVGNWGSYPVPQEIYSKVSKWKKNGWPYNSDKGRAEYLAWVDKMEEEARSREMSGEVSNG